VNERVATSTYKGSYIYNEAEEDLIRRNQMTKKPRVRFCWECGRKLRGNHFVEREVGGHIRILHKECSRLLEKGERSD